MRPPALVALLLLAGTVRAAMDECIDESTGRPQRCMPEFVNAAFNVTVVATNTCGSPPEEYCVQTGVTGVTKSCHLCDNSQPHLQHGAEYLTDYNNQAETTWWQSQTMLAGIQYPNSINLTLHLGKAFDITYVRLKFHTSRPESFVLYKRTREDGPWIPYQYYSGSCENTYLKSSRAFIRTGEDEQQALCTDEFSDISPLTGGNVAFSTLEGRPSAYNFDNSPVLQEWVTATDIRVSLNRLNTFGDEVFSDPKVLKSYYYAISDFAVGGRCKCNGHASECVRNEFQRLVCNCKHNTYGADCEKCLPFYNDRPWRRATANNANECLPCNCNGRSQECYFDPELYRSTGHGGHCTGCADNTDGPNCERCRENYYRQGSEEPCQPCHCNSVGSLSTQCDNFGRCSCKPGVMGEKCDRCQPGFHSLTEAGCRRHGCQCDPAGSIQGCDTEGTCVCKSAVTGERCDRCKPGFYHMDAARTEGCLKCFCHGHSTSCSSSNQHSVRNITSSFQKDTEGWSAVLKDGSPAPVPVRMSRHQKEVYLASRQREPLYFNAPAQFLGDQSVSYGQVLTVSFRVDRGRHRAGAEDLVLEGNGLRLYAPLTSSKTALPCRLPQTYSFRLDELSGSPWTPRLSHLDFRRLLSNLTSLQIRGTYGEYSTGYLQAVTLVSARPVPGEPAPWVEKCICPAGYQGHFCERCAPGYRRQSPGLGRLSACIPCNCQGGGVCDPDTGDCYSGDQNLNNDCADCPHGLYNDPRDPQNCLPCPCSAGIGCSLSPETQEPVCDQCPVGLGGPRCDVCADGYFGDPQGLSGPPRLCRPCECNNNIDPTVEGNCDRVTGECLKCIHNTGGFYCNSCREGFYGNPLDPNPELKCRACYCHPVGAENSGCQKDGSCVCRAGFEGENCDRPQCPSCYSQVSEKINLYKRELHGLTGANSNQQSPARGELEKRMRKAEAAAREMLRESEAAHGAEISLQRRLAGLQGSQSETQNELEQAQRKVQVAQAQSSQYLGQLREARGKIGNVRILLQGSQAELVGMTFPNTNSGLNSGTFAQLSQEAQTLGNRLAQEAQIVAQDAADAQADTQRVLQILRSGDADPAAGERLRARLEEARTQARALETEAIQSAAAAERSHHESMQTARALSQTARLNSVEFQAQLQRLQAESTALRDSVEADLSQSKNLQGKFNVWEQEAEEQLQEGQKSRVLADQFLSRANAAKIKAEQAMRTGNSTYYDIEGILSNLKGFDEKVGDRRSEAEDAMRLLPEIRRRVEAATDNSERAGNMLQGAERDANMATGNTGEAQSITSAIQLDMLRMGQDANSSAEMALALEREFAGLVRMTKGTADDLDTRTRTAERDGVAAEGIVQTALEAEAGASGADNAVTATLSALDHMLSLMDRPLVGNEEGLSELELSLRSARSQLSERLRPAVKDMELAAERQRQRILSVDSEISGMLIDIQSLRDIRDNLPPGCYSTTAIERP